MADQKIENLLNLALSASEEEREKSLELDVGYYPVARTWEVIIKYSGTLGRVREIAESVVELSNEFAIVTVREDRLEALAGIEAVEYREAQAIVFSSGKWKKSVLYDFGANPTTKTLWDRCACGNH